MSEMNCKRCWYYTELVIGLCEWPKETHIYRKYTPINEIRYCPRYGTKNPSFQTEDDEKTVAIKWYNKGKLE